jgi:hypothetical protein
MAPSRRALIAIAVFGVAAMGLLTQSAYCRTPIATETEPTSVVASRDRVVWSRAVNDCASANRPCPGRRYELMSYARGLTRRVPVRRRSVPFDVNIGRDGRNHEVVVYSRCRTEPRNTLATGLPQYTSGVGCAIYLYDFASRRETRFLAERGKSLVLPAVSRELLAFAAIRNAAARAAAGGEATVVVRRNAGMPSVQEVPTRDLASKSDPGPIGLSLDGRDLAFIWRGAQRSCQSSPGFPLSPGRSSVWLVSLAAKQLGKRPIDDVCSPGGDAYFLSPALDRGVLSYLSYAGSGQTSPGQTSDQVRRYTVADRSRTAMSFDHALGLAVVGSRIYWSERVVFDDPEQAARRRDTTIFSG